MPLEDLVTGIAIEYNVRGIDVLGKAATATDKAKIASDELFGSLVGLRGGFADLIAPMGAATVGMRDFTTATGAASRAARGMGASVDAGMRGASGAAKRAKAEWVDLHSSIVAAAAAADGFAFTGFGSSSAARAGTQSVLGGGSGTVAASWFGNRSGAPGAYGGDPALTGGFGGAARATVTAFEPLALGTAMKNVTPGAGGFGGGGGFTGGTAAAAAGGGGGGGGFGALAGLGAGLAGRGMPALGQALQAGAHAAIHGAMIAGELGLTTATDGLYESAKMQTLMLGVRNSTGASQAQMRVLQQSAYDVGDLTGMSANEAAKGMVNIARASGGVFRKKDGTFDMAGLNAIIPTVMSAAQIQHITRGTNVDEAATNMMEIVHMFRDFSGTPFKAIADDLTRLSEMMPTSLKAASRQFAYFEPTFKSMGISDMDAMSSFAMLARAGYGTGKGGTNLADLVSASLPALELTHHAQAGKAGLLRKYGFIDAKGKSDFFTDNKADLMGFYSHLADLGATHSRSELTGAFRSMFGVQGARIAHLAEDPQIAAQITAIEAIMRDPKISLANQFKGYQNTFGFQIGRAGGDFQSLTGEMMTSSLKGLTGGFRDLGNAMHGAQHYLHEHRDLELRIQRDVIGSVAGTERFITDHRADWKAFTGDLAWIGKEAEQSGPTLRAAGDALVVLGKAASAIVGLVVGSPLDILFRTVHGIEHPNATLTVGQRAALARNGPGSAPTPPAGIQPVTGSPGQRAAIMRSNAAIVNNYHVTQHFHGPAHPTAVRSAVESLQRHPHTSGTNARVPNALSVPHH